MADWAEKNRAHFNEAASTYNSKFSKTILQIIEEVQARREWIGVDWIDDSEDESSTLPEKKVRLLDYACGTGLVSRALAPYVSQSIGIDLSSSMVAEYNAGASNQGISEAEMHAVVGNIIDSTSSPDPSLSAPEFYGFDIAAVGMGWHHFTDPSFAAKRLAERLRPGGVLLIIDFLPHERFGHNHSHGNSHEHSHGHARRNGDKEAKLDGYGDDKSVDSAAAHTVIHLGFAEEDIKKMFEEAGVGKDFKHVVLGKGVVFESEGKSMRRTAFMARGMKG